MIIKRDINMIGYAMRRDWPDGIHDLVCWRRSQRRAAAKIAGDVEYWRRTTFRPTRHSVVAVSLRDFALHRRRRDCRAPDCPQPAAPARLVG